MLVKVRAASDDRQRVMEIATVFRVNVVDVTHSTLTLEATGKPVVVVVISGRPLIMNQQLDGAAAALMAYLPGTQGARGVADVLFGRVNPSGRLSVTWPKSVDQAPLTHDRLQGVRRAPRSSCPRPDTPRDAR